MLPSKESSRPIVCASELCTGRAISGIQWRPGSDDVLFTVADPQEGLAQSIFRWNVRTGAVHPVVNARGLANGGSDRFSACGLSAVALACVAAEEDRPPRLARIDMASERRQDLFTTNTARGPDQAPPQH